MNMAVPIPRSIKRQAKRWGAPFRANMLSTEIQRGIGELYPRDGGVGDSDYDRATFDHENRMVYVKAEEMREMGARRVENLIGFSEDLTQNWSTQANASITATTYSMDGSASRAAYLDSAVTGVSEGQTFIWTIDITPNNSGTFLMEAKDGVFGVASNIDTASAEVVSGERVRLSLPFTIPASPNGAVALDFFFSEDGSVTPYSATIHSNQLEESTGRSDTTTPRS